MYGRTKAAGCFLGSSPRDLKLGADPEVMKKTGQVLYVGDLAKEYGFTDIDGRWIPPYGLT